MSTIFAYNKTVIASRVRVGESSFFTDRPISDRVEKLVTEGKSRTQLAPDTSHSSWDSLDLEGILSPPPTSPSPALPSSPSALGPPPPPPPAPPRQSDPNKQLKRKVQTGVQKGENDLWKEKLSHYVMQGDYLALIMEEGTCVSWRSYMWDIPQGILKFAINAGINTLPSLDNLKRWSKRVSDRCPF